MNFDKQEFHVLKIKVLFVFYVKTILKKLHKFVNDIFPSSVLVYNNKFVNIAYAEH